QRTAYEVATCLEFMRVLFRSDDSAPVTSSQVTVVNTAPVVDSVSIDQSAPKTNDTLTVTVTKHDADGDSLTPAYQWYKNGVAILGATNATLNLGGAGNEIGRAKVRAPVTWHDGMEDS